MECNSEWETRFKRGQGKYFDRSNYRLPLKNKMVRNKPLETANRKCKLLSSVMYPTRNNWGREV